MQGTIEVPIDVTDIKPGQLTGPDIARNYVNLMIELSQNEAEMNAFLSIDNHQMYAKQKLDKVGIKVPEDLPIFFDKHDSTRPSIWIIKGKQAYLVNEKLLGFNFMGKRDLDEDKDGQTLEVRVKQGYMYNVSVNSLIDAVKKDIAMEHLEKVGDTIETVGKDYVEKWEYKKMEVDKAFSVNEIEKLEAAYDDIKSAKIDYLVLVRMPFLEINADIKLGYKVGDHDEIVLTSA